MVVATGWGKYLRGTGFQFGMMNLKMVVGGGGTTMEMYFIH